MPVDSMAQSQVNTLSSGFLSSASSQSSEIAGLAFRDSFYLNAPFQLHSSMVGASSVPTSNHFTGTLSVGDGSNPTRFDRYRDDFLLTGVTSGQAVRVNMTSSFDNYLQLVNADTGAVITANDDTNGLNAQLNFSVQAGVNYIVRATSYHARTEGIYDLQTNIGRLTTATPIQANQTFNGTIESSDSANNLRSGTFYDGYLLTGLTDGQRVQVNMTSSFDNYLQLVDAATGNVIQFNDDANGTLNAELNFTAQAGVSYLLRATSYYAGATGNYSISTNVGQFLTPGQAVTGVLDTSDLANPTRSGRYRDDFLLTGLTVGQAVRVNMTSSFDNYLQLVDAATGNVIQFNDDANGTLNAELNFTAQAGVSYLLRATSYYAGATGNYSISTNVGQFLTPGQAVTGVLDTSDLANPTRSGRYRDDFLLTGLTVGQAVRVNMTSSFDNYLQLVDAATGNVIQFNDDANGTLNAELNFTAQAGVSYLLRATSYYAGATGNYSININSAPLPPGYSATYGYGVVDAAAAVAQAVSQSPFPDVPNLDGNLWGVDMVNAPEAWAAGYTGQGIVVAVIDTGVDYTHADLDANIWRNTGEIPNNELDDDGNGYVDDVQGWDFVGNDNNPMDLNGHGTHVAGTISAENNEFGITGVAYDARIMPVRVLDASGSGDPIAIAAGIRYAANNGASVINLSLGGGYSSTMADAIEYATQRGVTVVMAAGNSGGSQPEFPANLSTQRGIAVGAVDRNRRMAGFSNRSGSSPVNYVVAPGVSVYSTIPGDSYDSFDGTSMATPHVAGVTALVLSANPNLAPAQVAQVLTTTANSANITA